MADARFTQPAHGFKQLTAVVCGSGGWRRCLAGEKFHLIVSRVYGPDVFAGVNSGELNGLSGVSRGTLYGVGPSGDLGAGYAPYVAVGSRDDSVVIIATGDSTEISLSQYQHRSEKGLPNGYAPLGEDGRLDSSYLPDTPPEETVDDIARRRSWLSM